MKNKFSFNKAKNKFSSNKSKKYFITFLILLVVLLIGIIFGKEFFNHSLEAEIKEENIETEKKEEAINNDYLIYQNSNWSFGMEYPKMWKIGEEKVDESGNFAISFLSPKESLDDNNTENITIIASSVHGLDFEKEISILIEKSKTESAFYIGDSKEIVSGFPAYKLDYLYDYSGTKLKIIHYVINAEDAWYQIVCYSLENTYSKYSENFDIMVNSFIIN
jgi:hypothetical protein